MFVSFVTSFIASVLLTTAQSVEERATGDGQAVYFKDASGERRVGRLRWSEQPALSSDTTRVIFEQRQDPNDILSSEIAVWDQDGSVPRAITFTEFVRESDGPCRY